MAILKGVLKSEPYPVFWIRTSSFGIAEILQNPVNNQAILKFCKDYYQSYIKEGARIRAPESNFSMYYNVLKDSSVNLSKFIRSDEDFGGDGLVPTEMPKFKIDE